MKAVVQRVSQAEVTVDDQSVAKIDAGLVVLVGFCHDDKKESCEPFLNKLLNLRIFEDAAGKMNLSVRDVGGRLLLVPQFTLYGDTRKGNRPSFVEAAPQEQGRALFDHLCMLARAADVPIETGVFQATMSVRLINEGPVTVLFEQ